MSNEHNMAGMTEVRVDTLVQVIRGKDYIIPREATEISRGLGTAVDE